MLINVTLSKKDQAWTFSGTIDSTKSVGASLVKVEYEGGLVIFQGDLKSAAEWIKSLLASG